MRKIICVVVLLAICCIGIYGADNIDYTWSLGDIGIANINFERNVSYSFSILNWSWIEMNTGLGFGFSLFHTHGYKDKLSAFLLPVEFMWNPLSTRLGNTGIYGTLGIYDRTGFGSSDKGFSSAKHPWNFFWTNVAGIRYVLSSVPFGRSKEKGKGNYRNNITLYAEYSVDTTWRVGLTVDYGTLLALLFLPIIYATEKPIDEDNLE
jgi:hypothetical protein